MVKASRISYHTPLQITLLFDALEEFRNRLLQRDPNRLVTGKKENELSLSTDSHYKALRGGLYDTLTTYFLGTSPHNRQSPEDILGRIIVNRRQAALKLELAPRFIGNLFEIHALDRHVSFQTIPYGMHSGKEIHLNRGFLYQEGASPQAESPARIVSRK